MERGSRSRLRGAGKRARVIASILEWYALTGLVVGAVGVVWVRLEGESWLLALALGYIGGATWPLTVASWFYDTWERLRERWLARRSS